MKNILFYCHDTVGFGHISRMLHICHALKGDHNIFVILGGNVPKEHFIGIPHVGLPFVDEVSEKYANSLSYSTMGKRFVIMKGIISQFQPDILLIDYYPFGRLALKREIHQLMGMVKEIYEAKVYTFMRDIFSGEKICDIKDIETVKRNISGHFGCGFTEICDTDFFSFDKYLHEKQIPHSITTHLLLEYYISSNYIDNILVFGDTDLYSLDSEFVVPQSIKEKFIYLGYLSAPTPVKKVVTKEQYILVSLGGSVFHIQNYIKIIGIILKYTDVDVKCVVPFFQKKMFLKIQKYFGDNSRVTFLPFQNHIQDVISGAKMYICGGGYGSFMDIISGNIPALIVLNYDETIEVNMSEQLKRYEIFQSYLPITALHQNFKVSEVKDFLENIEIKKEEYPGQGTLNLKKFFQK